MGYKKINIILAVVLFILVIGVIASCSNSDSELNDNPVIQISGLENGECLVPTISLWDGPELLNVVGTVDGACDSIAVEVLETKDLTEDSGRILYHIKTSDGQEGWITDSFVFD